MASRKIEDCIPELQEKYVLFRGKMQEAGIDFILTCTKRTEDEQRDLYAQGRTKPGRIVTWTLKSKHLLGKAFDIVIMKNGKLIWDTGIDTNDNSLSDWQEAGAIGESAGLIWGGRWKKPDMPHFEVV